MTMQANEGHGAQYTDGVMEEEEQEPAEKEEEEKGRTKEEWLELVHARIGEEQGGVVMRHDGRRGPEGVLPFVGKVVDEGLPHPRGWPGWWETRRRRRRGGERGLAGMTTTTP